MPLLGYQNTLRHGGRRYVLHTEDSGTHVHTAIFAEDGRVIATRKTRYVESSAPDLVKRLMQAQHRAAFVALRDGLFDDDESAGARAFAAGLTTVEGHRPRPRRGRFGPN